MNHLYWIGILVFLPVLILILLVLGEFLVSLHEMLEMLLDKKVMWFYYALFFLLILVGC